MSTWIFSRLLKVNIFKPRKHLPLTVSPYVSNFVNSSISHLVISPRNLGIILDSSLFSQSYIQSTKQFYLQNRIKIYPSLQQSQPSYHQLLLRLPQMFPNWSFDSTLASYKHDRTLVCLSNPVTAATPPFPTVF